MNVEGQAIALSQRWHVPYVSVDELVHGSDSAELMRLLQRRVEQPDMWDGWVLVGFRDRLLKLKLLTICC